jgi:hypothetical protein
MDGMPALFIKEMGEKREDALPTTGMMSLIAAALRERWTPCQHCAKFSEMMEA